MPGEGLSLAVATASQSNKVRQAVALLTDSFGKHDLELPFGVMFYPRWCWRDGRHVSASGLSIRAAWNLVSIWLMAQASREVKASCGLGEAEEWFLDSTQMPCQMLSGFVDAETSWRAQQLLVSVELNEDFWELLPYVLEEHGPGSRTSVMRDPSTAAARNAKRKDGVFYTPSDVADFMVRKVLENSGSREALKCFDPACGTGVFLLALLRALELKSSSAEDFDRLSVISRCLFGCDISGQALDACAFVLLHQCLSQVRERRMSAWAAWHVIRLNLVERDTLTIEPPSSGSEKESLASRDLLNTIRSQLSNVPSSYLAPEVRAPEQPEEALNQGLYLFARNVVRVGDIFPDARRGFDVLVGNPPYAALGEREDYSSLVASYHSVIAGKSVRHNSFLLFVETMWRLTTQGANASALVTPLSIAFHGGAQYQACRLAMTSKGGRWQFAFFDRQPHGLFGEEVKTRNAVLFRFENPRTPPRGERAEIETGPLRKWTSRTRKDLFRDIDFTSLGQSSISCGIPKLRGESQAEALRSLRGRLERLPSFCVNITSCPPHQALEKPLVPRIFVGGTAYNFINAYRNTELLDGEREFPLSNSRIHCLEFRTDYDAQVGFAILSSRLSFWLWHVLGDGFHLGEWLFDEIPFSRQSFSEDDYYNLASLGGTLWERLQAHRFISLNGGKQTIGFRPLACNEERDAIDSLLLRSARLPEEFANELRLFVHDNAVVDAEDHRRNYLQKYFSASQTT